MIYAWAETRCTGTDTNIDWEKCRKVVNDYKTGKQYAPQFASVLGGMNHETLSLYRIIKGELYYDWPWGMERMHGEGLVRAYYPLMILLNSVNDLEDSVFLFGGEHPRLPWQFPFAHIVMV